MKKLLPKLLLIVAVIVTMLNSVLIVSAQVQTPTQTPIPTLTSTPNLVLNSTPTSVVAQLANPNVVTFAQLQQNEIQLNGPYDSSAFSFGIPADWTLQEGAEVNLSFGVSFNTDVRIQNNNVVVGGGSLTVFVNGNVLVTLPLNQVGEDEMKIGIPVTALVSNRDDGRIEMRFVLNSGVDCRTIGLYTTLTIHPTSYLFLPHANVPPSLSLTNFPRPIVQNSFMPDSALLIVPDQPSPAELQAAFTIAAGLGNMSGNQIFLDMTTLSGLKSENAGNSHIILIGKASSLPWLGELKLPLPVVNGQQFQLSDNGTDDGLIQMIESPWSSSHVILVISANTDQGVVKAAQAVSTGVLRPSRFENLAEVEQVNLVPTINSQTIDRSLTDLGYQGESFQSVGYAGVGYVFNIPVGMSVSSDAYFELVYGHSALINYDSSQIVLSLNDKQIGSVRMDDSTASNPTNHVKILIPPSAVIQGNNELRVTVYIERRDECIPPNVEGLWINVWPQSTFHLPLVGKAYDPVASQDMADYPAPFIYDPVLGNTAFILEHNDLESWRKALQIAAYLGNQKGGPFTTLSVFYGDGMPATDRSKYNLLIIGRPSQMPIVSDMNDYLPAPFSAEGDIASESNFQVTYRIPPDSPLGYVETMQSPWNPDNVVLAILGNTPQGVSWAASSLIDPKLRSRLFGNFAVVSDQQIITTDIRFAAQNATTGVDATATPNVTGEQLEASQYDVPVSHSGWILPVLALLIGLIVLILVIVIIRSWSRNRTRHKD